MVEQIGEGVQELGVLARGINEVMYEYKGNTKKGLLLMSVVAQEIVVQNMMLDGLDDRIGRANESGI